MSSAYSVVLQERDTARSQAEFWKARWTEACELAGVAVAMSLEVAGPGCWTEAPSPRITWDPRKAGVQNGPLEDAR